MKHPMLACSVTGLFLILMAASALDLFWTLPGHATASVLDVGQGDSTLLTSPSGAQIIVDGGPGDALMRALPSQMPFLDRTIELIVLTHPNTDHYQGFFPLLKRYRVLRALVTGVGYASTTYDALIKALKEEGTEIIIAEAGNDIDFGDGLLLDVVWPAHSLSGTLSTEKDVNDTSIVLRAIGPEGKAILLTGDIEETGEKALLATGADVRADVLKIGHHGGKTSTSSGLLLATNPRSAVISVATKNGYGHPHPVTMTRLKSFAIPTRTTAHDGTIRIPLE
jgi:competence protein ComEC